MPLPRSIIAVTLLGALVAACGGAAATRGPDGPGATSGNGGQATQDPGPGQTQGGNGGNGGNGGGEFGSVKFTVSGPFDKSDEFPFIPAGSMFGSQAGTVMNFSKADDNTAIVSILIGVEGNVVVSYTGVDGQVPGAECTTRDWNIEARGGSGKFDCTASLSFTGSGAAIQGGKIVGEFTART